MMIKERVLFRFGIFENTDLVFEFIKMIIPGLMV